MHPEIMCHMEDFFGVRLDAQNQAKSPILFKGKSFQRCMQLFDKQQIRDVTPKQVVEHFYNIFAAPLPACGFKFKFPLQLELFPEVLREIEFLGPSLRIILLNRNNYLKQAISRKNLERSRAHLNSDANLDDENKFAEKKVRQPFAIDVSSVIAYARQLEKQQTDFEQSAFQICERTGGELLQISYEDLLAKEHEMQARLFQFLGVDAEQTVQSWIKKMTPDKLSDVILNYEELVQEVSGTDFEWML